MIIVVLLLQKAAAQTCPHCFPLFLLLPAPYCSPLLPLLLEQNHSPLKHSSLLEERRRMTTCMATQSSCIYHISPSLSFILIALHWLKMYCVIYFLLGYKTQVHLFAVVTSQVFSVICTGLHKSKNCFSLYCAHSSSWFYELV